MTIKKAVVLAAGEGTRMRPLTLAIQKTMLPIGSKPNMHYLVEALVACGITEILFITGVHADQIERYFGSDNFGASFHYIQQVKQDGTGTALYLAKEWVGSDSFLFMYGDTFFQGAEFIFNRVKCIQEENNPLCTAACYEVPTKELSRRGIFEAEGNTEEDGFRITGLQEKPEPEEAKSNLAHAAIYGFNSGIFELIPKTKPNPKNGEIILAETVGDGIRQGELVLGTKLGPKELRLDIGTPEGYEKTNLFFLSQTHS